MEVYHSGNFWGHHKKEEQALQEIKLNREFVWEDVRGFIPAIYTGTDGFVIDLCVRIDRQRIEAFIEKWLDRAESGKLTEKEHEQLMREDPYKERFSIDVAVNGETLPHAHGCGCCFNPVMIERQERLAAEERARFAAEHAQAYEAGAELLSDEGSEQKGCSLEEMLADAYGCDKGQGWYFMRSAFQWPGTEISYEENTDGNMDERRVPGVQIEKIESVSVTFHAEKTSISAEAFETASDCKGQQVELHDPFTGERVLLTIHECEDAVLPEETFRNVQGMEYPTHYRTISYTTEPELAQDALMVQDLARGDAPRMRNVEESEGEDKTDGSRTEVRLACTVALIGGADGPTSIFIAGRSPVKERRIAMSALHFEPVERVSWKPTFRRTERSDMTMELSIIQ